MLYRSPKRIYTNSALEFWFERLSSNWEKYFSPEELSNGRSIYRSGEIREVELNNGDAIIHYKLHQNEYYALIDWGKDQFEIRYSTEDRILGKSLAAAGFYEIEELVADEISPVPSFEKITDEIKEEHPEEEVPHPETSQENGRDLILKLDSTYNGLTLESSWQETGKHLNGSKLLNGRQGIAELTSKERETLIRLTSKLHKVGFTNQKRTKKYILSDHARICSFLNEDLPTWHDYFRVEINHRVRTLIRGLQSVDVEAVAKTDNGKLNLTWIMQVGNRTLTDEETQIILKRGRNSVILPDLGMVKVPEDKAGILADWQKYLDENITGDLPKYMLFSLFDRQVIRLNLSSELEQWRDSLLEPPLKNGVLPDLLRPYQKRGVAWLAHLFEKECHALLADEMGLGKTLQTAALIDYRPINGMRHLVVCPASVVPVWKNELDKYFPHLKTEVLKSNHNFITHSDSVIWLSSYTQLRRQKAVLDEVEFGYAILDEAQLIKNPEAKVTIACLNIKARHRVILTGTPLENRHLDLWTLFRYLMPGLLGGRRKFEKSVQDNETGLLEKLNRQIAPFVLRRTKKDVIKELPPKLEMNLICPLTDIQQQQYMSITEQGISALGENLKKVASERTISLFTLLTRLRQVCCDPDLLPWLSADLNQSGKINILLEKLEEIIANGHKVVIFSQFVSLLKRVRLGIEDRFEYIPIYELTGKTLDREKPVKQFQEGDAGSIILVSLRAGGTGITLHAADYVFLLDPWWNPAVESQAIDRVHRIGQDKTVSVYRMITTGTIEERIERLKINKRELFDQLVGGISDMSDFKNHFNSLSELISLSITSPTK